MTAMIFIVMLSFYYFSRHVSDAPTPGRSLCSTSSPSAPYFLQAPRQKDLSPAVNSISSSSPGKALQDHSSAGDTPVPPPWLGVAPRPMRAP